MTADFSGYATRNNLRCSDGRTILADAFAEQDGGRVPLVWQHGHDDVSNVLGYVDLENQPDGVRAHAYFNNTPAGQHAKEMVKHGDVKFLSIFANGLVEKAKQVAHGVIREVSLVLAGANPGATIDNLSVVHSDGDVEVYNDEAVISFVGEGFEISHADKAKKDAPATQAADDASGSDDDLVHILSTLTPEQESAVAYLLSEALSGGGDSAKHSDTEPEPEPESDKDKADADKVDADPDSDKDKADADRVDADADSDKDKADADSDKDKADADKADADPDKDEADADPDKDKTDTDPEDADKADADKADADKADAGSTTTEAGDVVQHNNQEDNSMTHNVFDQSSATGTVAHTQTKLSEEQVSGIIKHADELGSLKKAMRHYAINEGVTVGGELKHGIENIEYLFPDSKLLESSPAFISRRMEWVDKVLGAVRKSPFSRVKTVTADITPDEARARGYIKGNMKNEEYFELAKRETTPQTVYKKQKLDRDDVIDIVDLDVVAWMKAEMKVMLDEEIAGAILVGDGRSFGDEDKIKEDKIRPIATDAELYVTTAYVNIDDSNSSIEELVDSVIDHRQYYKGTGQPTFYTTETVISAFLRVKDSFGRRIYANLDEVKTVLRVVDIVPVEIMERQPDILGIMVNLTDYTVGTDRGGQATMFDDFDIDYNKLRYLIETRLSGALTTPKAAIVFRKVAASSTLVAPVEPTFVKSSGLLTVPTVTGVVYKDGAGTTLTTGSPVTVAPGSSVDVVATPASGKYFADNVNDQWTYKRDA